MSHQLGGFDLKGPSKPDYIRQADITLTPLYAPNVGTVKPREVCQLFLRPTSCDPMSPNIFSELLEIALLHHVILNLR